MSVSHVYVIRASFTFLLPLQETLKDNKSGSKLLPLPWVPEHMEFSVHTFKVESVFPTVLWISWNKSVNIQSQTFEGIIFLCRIPGLGSLRPGSDSLIINGKIFSCNYSQSYSLDNTVSPLLLPISLWFLYIFSYRIYFLVDSSLSHQQLLINNCNFGLHMRVGKFWVFLLCHVVAISNRFKSWSTY